MTNITANQIQTIPYETLHRDMSSPHLQYNKCVSSTCPSSCSTSTSHVSSCLRRQLMHWEDWEVEWRSLYFQAFSSYRRTVFSLSNSKATQATLSVLLLVLFKILRIAMLPYPPNAVLCPCQSSASVEDRCMSFTLPNSDASGGKCLQAKDILHHRLPLVAHWRLSWLL